MSGDPPAQGRRIARSLGAIANLSLGTALVTAIAGSLVVWLSFTNLLDTRQQLFDRIEPARVQAQQLRAALLDQETGVRGFALTRNIRFLEPYQSGQADQARIEDDLHRSIGQFNADAQRRIDAVSAGAEDWRRTVAEPIIASSSPPDDEQVFEDSKRVFDGLRLEIDGLDEQVARESERTRQRLDSATWQLGTAIGVAIAGLTASGLFGYWLLRRRVVEPLERLVSETDNVSAGRFGTPIHADGPAEIERLAGRVEHMRLRIVDELATTEEAKVQLAEQAQDLERSNRDLEQFAYVASHDLQEPLRKVASFCQLLEQRYAAELDDKGVLYIQYAVDGAKRMQALISDLLDFSRVGRQVEHFVPVDLAQLTDAVIESYGEAIAEIGATIERGPMPVVHGDPSLLGALVQNLIGNALKYRSETPLVVRFSSERRTDGYDGDQRRGEWTMTCSDNGIGIDEQFRERVFVIFQRLHGRDAFDGTGIGLALCKKIVEYHGGRIWVDDPVDGSGATLRWTMPLGADASPTSLLPTPPTPSTPTDSTAPTEIEARP